MKNKPQLWFISDTHFGHENIIKYSKRPFKDTAEMDVHMINLWNSRVQPEDTVYHLGDFALSGGKKCLPSTFNRLNGNIVFIKGNHDKAEALEDVTGQPLSSYLELYHKKQMIVLCHYSLRVWNKAHRGAWHLFGHSHGALNNLELGKSMDVGVDSLNSLGYDYGPISFDQVKAHMDKQDFINVDHHHPDKIGNK